MTKMTILAQIEVPDEYTPGAVGHALQNLIDDMRGRVKESLVLLGHHDVDTITCFCCGATVPELSAHLVDIDGDPEQAENVCELCFQRGAYNRAGEAKPND